MRPTVTLDAAFAQVLAEAAAPKLAEAPKPASTPLGSDLRKIAEVLRTAPEPEVGWDHLHRVKEAAFELCLPRPSRPALEPLTGNVPDDLHKIAAALRAEGDDQDRRLMEKAGHMIVAAKGLTILRDKLRGWYELVP